VADVEDAVRRLGPSHRARPIPADQSVSSVTVSGQRISSAVCGRSTAPAGSTAGGSARNAAHRAMSAAVLHIAAAGATARRSITGSARAWSEYASTR
jgi:hypothetical protein